VSIELTTQMLATLFDFPFEDRRLLTYWSDVATCGPHTRWADRDPAERDGRAGPNAGVLRRLWNERVNATAAQRPVSMLAHGAATKQHAADGVLGNLVLLIVGGNDTTRNSCGGLLALNQHPRGVGQAARQPGLVDSLVPEIIRWQTPLATCAAPRAATPSSAASRSRRATRW
jgi:cytochrome P450